MGSVTKYVLYLTLAFAGVQGSGAVQIPPFIPAASRTAIATSATLHARPPSRPGLYARAGSDTPLEEEEEGPELFSGSTIKPGFAAELAGHGNPTVTACKLVTGIGPGTNTFDGVWTHYSYGGTITEIINYGCPSHCQPDLVLETIHLAGHGPVMPYSKTVTVATDVTVTVGRCADGGATQAIDEEPTPVTTHTTTATYSFIGPGFPVVDILRISRASIVPSSTSTSTTTR